MVATSYHVRVEFPHLFVSHHLYHIIFALNSGILVPEDAPVRLTSAQLEELDYRKLYEAYAPKGRKPVTDPRVLFIVLAYGYQCGIYTTRKQEEVCCYRIDFQWLLGEEPVPDYSTIALFRTGRCMEAVDHQRQGGERGAGRRDVPPDL